MHLYHCLAGFAVLFILDIWETYSCDIAPIIGAFSDEGEPFNPDIAKAGLCNHEQYGYPENTAQQTDCKDCQAAVQKNKDISYYINWVCDRIYCPSAPSVQKYVKDNQDITSIVPASGIPAKKEQEIPSAAGALGGLIGPVVAKATEGDELFFGSSCQGVSATNYEDVKKILEEYKENKDDEVEEDEVYNEEDPNCNNLHPSNPKCCGFEYDEKYDSACIFHDELKQSKCVQANIQGIADPDCTGIFQGLNSIAGFCESDGGPAGDLIQTDLAMTNMPANAKTRTFFLHVRTGTGSTPGQRTSARTVRGAYEVTKKEAGTELTAKDFLQITEVNGLQLTGDYSEFFQNQDPKCDAQFLRLIQQKEKANFDLTVREGTRAGTSMERAAIDACVKVKATFPDNRQYIVDPTSSFLRSLQCGCIAGVNSYLKQYRNILTAVNNCLKSILVTGDGYEGQCDAALSTYICDLIYEIISCAVEFTSVGGEREETGKFGLGNIAQALTDSGAKTQQRINNRYGETSMFNTMFGEKKIVHSICLFAFTGTWSFDVSSFLEAGIPAVPIDSTAFIFPAERRFVSFDSATQPSGLTTHNYHIGFSVAAGADLTQRMFLQCSADFSCRESDGFQNNQCDCLRSGQRRVPVGLRSGGLKAGELYTEEIYMNVAGTGAPVGDVRFDKIIYEYDYRDANDISRTKTVITDINGVGGQAPAFCQFDILTSTYRCTLDIGSERYAQFTGNPIPIFSAEGAAYNQFKLGETVAFRVPVLQRSDESCNVQHCRDTKYIIYTIKAGNQIIRSLDRLTGTNDLFANNPQVQGRDFSQGLPQPLKPSEILNTNGESTREVRTITVNENIFKGTTESFFEVTPKKYVNMFDLIGTPPRTIDLYVFDNFVNEYESGQKPGGTIKASYSRQKRGDKEADIVNNRLRIPGTGIRLVLPTPETQKRIFEENKPNPIHVRLIKETTEESYCKQFERTPRTLTAEFELRDAVEIQPGVFEPSPTTAVDSQGTPQQRTIDFDVVCSNTYVETEESLLGGRRRRCELGVFVPQTCQCVADDGAFQERIAKSQLPNCAPPTTIVGGIEGDYCSDAGKCIPSKRCSINTPLESACRCYADQVTLKAAVENQEPENCAKQATGNVRNICTPQGECEVTSILDLLIIPSPFTDTYDTEKFKIINDEVTIPPNEQFVIAIVTTPNTKFEAPDLNFQYLDLGPYGAFVSQELKFDKPTTKTYPIKMTLDGIDVSKDLKVIIAEEPSLVYQFGMDILVYQPGFPQRFRIANRQAQVPTGQDFEIYIHDVEEKIQQVLPGELSFGDFTLAGRKMLKSQKLKFDTPQTKKYTVEIVTRDAQKIVQEVTITAGAGVQPITTPTEQELIFIHPSQDGAPTAGTDYKIINGAVTVPSNLPFHIAISSLEAEEMLPGELQFQQGLAGDAWVSQPITPPAIERTYTINYLDYQGASKTNYVIITTGPPRKMDLVIYVGDLYNPHTIIVPKDLGLFENVEIIAGQPFYFVIFGVPSERIVSSPGLRFTFGEVGPSTGYYSEQLSYITPQNKRFHIEYRENDGIILKENFYVNIKSAIAPAFQQ